MNREKRRPENKKMSLISLPYSKRAEEIEAYAYQNNSCNKSYHSVCFFKSDSLPRVTSNMSAARGRLKPTA